MVDTAKSHAQAFTAITSVLVTLVASVVVAYEHFATDAELRAHDTDPFAHNDRYRDLLGRIERVEALDAARAGVLSANTEDLAYVAERYVRLVAADAEPDRTKRARAGEQAVQDYRALIHRGQRIQDAVYEALRRR